jgi:hypothetical protein
MKRDRHSLIDGVLNDDEAELLATFKSKLTAAELETRDARGKSAQWLINKVLN